MGFFITVLFQYKKSKSLNPLLIKWSFNEPLFYKDELG